MLIVLKEWLGHRRHQNKVSDSVTKCVCWWRSGVSAATRVISRHPDVRWITGGGGGQRTLSLYCHYSSPHFLTSLGKEINTLAIYGTKGSVSQTN